MTNWKRQLGRTKGNISILVVDQHEGINYRKKMYCKYTF